MSIAQQRNMNGALKKYDQAEASIYDVKAKDVMIEYLNEKFTDCSTIENPNKYGIDLLTINSEGKVVHCWELEVRHGNWKGDVSFPYNEVNCIERKDYQWRRDKEFLDKIPFSLADEYFVSYVQLNKECTRAVIIDSKTILQHDLVQWANRKAEGEYVRQVPIYKTVQVKL